MSDLERITISLERELCHKLDEMVESQHAANRSKFVADLIRARLVEEEWNGNVDVLGVITLVYDHHTPGLSARMIDVQHAHYGVILASTHVHLDDDLCAEVILMRGRATRLKEIADRLRGMRGVLHAQLSTSTVGTMLRGEPHNHSHPHDDANDSFLCTSTGGKESASSIATRRR